MMSKIVLALFATMTATSASAHYVCKGFEAQIGAEGRYIASESVFRLYLRKAETGEPIASARGKWFDGADFEATGDWTEAANKMLHVKLSNTPDETRWSGSAPPGDLVGMIMRPQSISDHDRFIRCLPTELY